MPRSDPQYVGPECTIDRHSDGGYCRTHYKAIYTCPECGQEFHSKRRGTTTCSDRCRKRQARRPGASVTAAVTPQPGQSVTGIVSHFSQDNIPLTNDTGAAVTVTFHSTFATRLTSEQTQAIAAALAQNPTGDVLIRFIRPRRQE